MVGNSVDMDEQFGGGWDYRIVRHNVDTDEVFYAIHEVYYNHEHRETTCAVDPADVVSDVGAAFDGADCIKKVLEMMIEAVEKPILDYEDFKS